MEKTYTAPNILRLMGITPHDYRPVEDLLDEKLLDDLGAAPVGADQSIVHGESAAIGRALEETPTLDTIPKVFTGLDAWPEKTNLRCWDSDFYFDDRPKFVPTYVTTNESGELEIGVKGNFMTFNNAARWIRTTVHSTEQQWRMLDMLYLVYRLFTGASATHIESAPDKTKMAKYGGGDWDEDVYLRELRALDPVNGLKNHTPGSILCEREKRATARSEERKNGLNTL